MSYILDALKKSEQERGHGNIPDVQTVHTSSLNYRNEKKAYWPYLLIIAILLNLLAIIYFIVNKDPDKIVNTPQVITESHTIPTEVEQSGEEITPNTAEKYEPKTAVVENNSISNNTTIKAKTLDTNAADANTLNTNANQSDNIKTKPPTISDSGAIIDFHELPKSIKQELPTIIISAHVYSTNPAQRSIVINNDFMEEGEYVLDGLILYEITRDGAIFNYQGTLFSYAVVSGWQ